MFLKPKVINLLFLATLVNSQGFASDLCAKIRDYGKLPLPRALVTARELNTNKLFSARTDASGKACFSKVEEGVYAVEAGLVGFLNVRYYPVRVAPASRVMLTFELPLGEITEGGLGEDAILSGTLKYDNLPLIVSKLCILNSSRAQVACVTTNDLGEYTVSVPPGEYEAEIQSREGKIYRSRLGILTPGLYHNLIAPVWTNERGGAIR